MKKKKYYRAGAVFEVGEMGMYILSQTGNAEYNLISLENDSNRKTDPIKCNIRWDLGHSYFSISDKVIRKMIGHRAPRKTRKYSYLGQFPEVFERTGQ